MLVEISLLETRKCFHMADVFNQLKRLLLWNGEKEAGLSRGRQSSKHLHSYQIIPDSYVVNWLILQLFIVECFGIVLNDNSCSPKIPKHWQACVFTLKSSTFLCLPGSEHCFRNFTAATGLIESPDFPDKYPHNLECSYIIIAPPQTEVTLTFKTFDLENDPLLMTEAECKYDWLEVWDGLPQGELLNE